MEPGANPQASAGPKSRGSRTQTRVPAPNAFSKKVENLEHMLAIFYCYYNFVRIHQTIRCTPAMEAGVETRLWSIKDLVGLLERTEDRATGTDSN